jgi:ribosomal protein S2
MVYTILSRLTSKQLILANAYLGTQCSLLNVKLKPYLLGRRNNYYILDISFTFFQFRVITEILIKLFLFRQKILVIKDLDYYNLTATFTCKNIFFFDRKWIGGNLTNFRIVRKSKRFIKENSKYNSLGALRYIPSFFFFFNAFISKWALFEAYNLEIPIAGILSNTSPFFEFINYPLIGNNRSFEALYLYISILKYSYLKAEQTEKLNILRLNII